MQVYNDELYHFGKLGMKWGHRKGPTNEVMRNDRNKIHKQEVKKAYQRNKVDQKMGEAYDYANKHHLDGDDGGGGSRTAGVKFQKMLDEVDGLETKAMYEAGQETSKRMIKKYGQDKISDLKKSDKIRFYVGAAAVAAIPAVTIAATVMSDLR